MIDTVPEQSLKEREALRRSAIATAAGGLLSSSKIACLCVNQSTVLARSVRSWRTIVASSTVLHAPYPHQARYAAKRR